MVTRATNDAHTIAQPMQPTKQKQKRKRTSPQVTIAQAKKIVRDAEVVEWGKVKRVDSEEGDTMYASALRTLLHDSREASFVRVSHR